MKLSLVAAVSAVVVSLVAVIPAAQAQQKVNPWKQCGIGAMIFDDNGAAAAISNIIWDLGTTAVSSNISSQDSCEGVNVAAAQFINDSIINIEEETVIGQGENLTAMLNIMGCEVSAHQAIISAVRSELDLSAADNNAKAEAYYLQLEGKTSGQFFAQCQVI
ncbi:DUF3015 family protein [Arsukibacterium sp. UBA3155]|uniref:DUF3015 family protein n=1 Tax=Arsukibacterium sp. UBA3155 TaxID=1946058 RepID=UPI0025C65CFA|nr:DUF3015 family protein [Arsukibacterium sp. UBA3155]|tara:strand:- start:94720 stop:95205 length:486 start_codon:yes stop_codon:yes gene_type:complete